MIGFGPVELCAGHGAAIKLTGLMQWYYAVGSNRRGPVETITFNRLVANGTVDQETLVWHTGMAEWQPWSVVAPTVADVVRPMEIDPQDVELLSEDTISEASDPADRPDENDAELPMEELWARIQAHGYAFSIGGCLSRSFELLKVNYWGAVGTTLLVMILSIAVQQIPMVELIAAFWVVPQLTAGIWWYFIKRARGSAATLGDIFAGFKRCWRQLAMVAFFQSPVILGSMAFEWATKTGYKPTVGEGSMIAVVALLMFIVMFRWQFAQALVIDRGYGALDAIKLSWRIVGLRFWSLFGLGLVLSCLMIIGALALLVGLVFILPLFFIAMVEAYEDAIRPNR